MSDFDPATNGWDDYLQTPWARVRYDVVRRVLDDRLDMLGSASSPLELEWALGERDPYRDLARAWQVVARRAGRNDPIASGRQQQGG